MNAHSAIADIRVRHASPSDAEESRRIDSFIAAHPGAQLFHRPQWSFAVERGCGQRGHLLLAEDGEGRIAGLLPLTAVRSPLFGSALVSSGFGVGGGILAEEASIETLLADAASALAVELGCASVELRGGPVPAGFEPREGLHAGFERGLPAGDEAILKAIPRKQRAEVRRAQGNGMTVTVGRGAEDRRAHFRSYAESVRNLGTPVFPPALFGAMLDAFGEDADILTIWKDGRPVASVLSFYFRGTVFPYWGGGTREARALRANELLYFEL
ncbi:MAG: GNAT family N-acetyltransferase, partial [Sphingomonadales bacterium]